jgi:hypothetical protein
LNKKIIIFTLIFIVLIISCVYVDSKIEITGKVVNSGDKTFFQKIIDFFSGDSSQDNPPLRQNSTDWEFPSTQTLSSSLVGNYTISASNILFPTVPQFYSPDIMYDDGNYKMWVTAGDRIRLYTSSDGISWVGGQTVFSAQPNTWEDDGGNFEGYQGGISDPRVVKNVTPGWKYTMYYTAGPVLRGGMGVAFSNDGMTWTRWNGNPLKTFENGHTFASKNFLINGTHYLYFLGGGSVNSSPDVRVMRDNGDGISFTKEKILIFAGNVYPILYDSQTNSCWLARNNYAAGVSSGPVSIDIFAGSDCFTTNGVKIATISSTETGMISNFGAYPKEVISGGIMLPSAQNTGVQLF